MVHLIVRLQSVFFAYSFIRVKGIPMWPFNKKVDKTPSVVQLFIRFQDGTYRIQPHEYINYQRMRYLLTVTSLQIDNKPVKELQVIKLKEKPAAFRFSWLRSKRKLSVVQV
jgi:hypothetical protein